jgi:radical SAM superfamily enzyme YgiQ (UPF0313 family)
MKTRVLLVSNNGCTTPDPVFPLGLSFLNSALRQAGHETLWADKLAGNESIADLAAGFRPDAAGISVRNIDDVIISKQETYFDNLALLVEIIHQAAGCPVVLGGSGFSIFPRQLLELSGANYGICGEGETAFVSLLAALGNQSGLSTIPGLVYRINGRVVVNRNEGGSPNCHLTADDRPAAIAGYYLRDGGMMNLQTQRGCACHCCYCTYPLIEGSRSRRRDAETVADEFEQLQDLGCRYVSIVDSVFNSSPRHVTEICEALLRRRTKLPWGCFLRPQGLNAELMRLMRRAGLSHIEFGSDSFNDEVLAAYQKGLTFDDIEHSSELAAREEIDVCHFLIIGGPGETMETLRRSCEASRHLKDAVIMSVVGMRIYPETPLFHQAVAEGLLPPDRNLLAPTYYLSAELHQEAVFTLLKAFARQSPNWIVGDPVPAYRKLVERLRKRGMSGPLWSYLSVMQRLTPASAREQ